MSCCKLFSLLVQSTVGVRTNDQNGANNDAGSYNHVGRNLEVYRSTIAGSTPFENEFLIFSLYNFFFKMKFCCTEILYGYI